MCRHDICPKLIIFAFKNGAFMENEEIKEVKVDHHIPSGWIEGSRLLDGGELIIVESGSVKLQLNREIHQLGAGSVVVLFPGDIVYAEAVEPSSSLRRLSYSFRVLREACLQLELIGYVSIHRNLAVTTRPDFVKLAGAVVDVVECVLSDRESRVKEKVVVLQLQSFFSCLADYASRRYPVNNIVEEGSYRTSRLFSKFMELLENHYKESHEVKFYADLLNITPKYLTTVCTKSTGHSAKALINDFLTIKLKLALRHTEASVKEISVAHNFPTLSYFCQYFKQNAGMPPQEYRLGKWRKK